MQQAIREFARDFLPKAAFLGLIGLACVMYIIYLGIQIVNNVSNPRLSRRKPAGQLTSEASCHSPQPMSADTIDEPASEKPSGQVIYLDDVRKARAAARRREVPARSKW